MWFVDWVYKLATAFWPYGWLSWAFWLKDNWKEKASLCRGNLGMCLWLYCFQVLWRRMYLSWRMMFVFKISCSLESSNSKRQLSTAPELDLTKLLFLLFTKKILDCYKLTPRLQLSKQMKTFYTIKWTHRSVADVNYKTERHFEFFHSEIFPLFYLTVSYDFNSSYCMCVILLHNLFI